MEWTWKNNIIIFRLKQQQTTKFEYVDINTKIDMMYRKDDFGKIYVILDEMEKLFGGYVSHILRLYYHSR